MADNSAVLPFDNYAQDGDQSLEEAVQAVAAVNSGQRPLVADVVRDPTTGKLIQARLIFPDTVATAAVDAINKNPGVVSTCLNLAIPPQGFVNTLADVDGMLFTGTLVSGDFILMAGGNQSAYGRLTGGNVYAQLLDPANTIGAGSWIDVRAVQNADLVWLATDTLTLAYKDGSPSIVVSPAADYTVPMGSQHHFWFDLSGKMYLKRGETERHTYDFSTACLGPI
jgi:hypothetical protein